MDKLFIHGMRLSCNIGWTDDERDSRQVITVDAELFKDLKGLGDDNSRMMDHAKIRAELSKLANSFRCNSLETFAEKIADVLLEKFSPDSVTINVKKPKQHRGVDFVGVEISKEK